MLKPVPLIEADFTVTASEPDEVSVNDSVFEEFTLTLPKLNVEALTVSFGLRLAALAYGPDRKQQSASRHTPNHPPRRGWLGIDLKDFCEGR